MRKRNDAGKSWGSSSMRQSIRSPATFMSAMLIALGLLGFAGCGSEQNGPGRVKVFPAQGTVKLAGQQDLEGALIVLHPADGSKPQYPNPRGKAEKDGSFKIGTYDKSDGAPPGEYKVTVEYYPIVPEGDDVKRGPNAVPKLFTSPQTTTLKAKITAGDNQLTPFDLAAQ